MTSDFNRATLFFVKVFFMLFFNSMFTAIIAVHVQSEGFLA